MNKYNRSMTYAVVIGVALVGSTPAGFALGFRNPDQGARATGQGEAFVAQVDDASAIYYNPGGLTQVKGTQVTSGSLVSFRDIKFTGTFGQQATLTDPFMIPHLYCASDFGLERWRFGLGVNVPYGTGVDWGDTGPLRYAATQSRMTVLNIEPTAAYQVNEQFSVGLGLNIYQADTTLKRAIFTGGPDAYFKFNGDGTAVGATVGLLYRFNEQHSLGLVYRSPFRVNFEGTTRIDLFEPTSKNGNATLEFPQSVAMGYAFRPTKKLKLEVDIEWTDWDTLNTVTLNAPGAMADGTTIPFNWISGFFYEFGVQYQLNDNWVLRGGYIYSENTVPDSTYSPTLPDSNRHVFSVGVGYTATRFNIDVVYQYSLSNDRTVSGSPLASPPFLGRPADGKWESQGHALMFTSTIKF